MQLSDYLKLIFLIIMLVIFGTGIWYIFTHKMASPKFIMYAQGVIAGFISIVLICLLINFPNVVHHRNQIDVKINQVKQQLNGIRHNPTEYHNLQQQLTKLKNKRDTLNVTP